MTREEQRNNSTACFERAVRYDLMIRNQKIAGAAQRRTRDGLLHQGSIQLANSDVLRDRFAARFARSVRRRDLAAEEVERAESLALKKYATREWLERR
jgi:lipoate-protein ligase A